MPDSGRAASGAAGDIDGRFRQPVGGAHHIFAKVVRGESLAEPVQRGRMDPFGTADDSQHVPEIDPVEVRIRGLSRGHLQREIRRRGEYGDRFGHRSDPPRRALQKGDRACQVAEVAAQDGREDSEDQAHIVVERQPRHDCHVPRGHAAELREVVGHQLLEVHRQVPVGDHHPGRPAGRAGCVLQVCGARCVAHPNARRARVVQIQGIDFDDGAVPVGLLQVLAHGGGAGGCREDDGGLRVREHGGYPFVVRAGRRNRQRNRDQPGLHRAQEGDDVGKTLRGQDHGAVPDRALPLHLVRNVQGALVQLGPGQGFGDPRPIVLVIGVAERQIVGL